MTFVEMNPAHLPLALLLEADPAASRIAAYLPGAWGFAALADNEVVGAWWGSKPPRSSTSPLPPTASSRASAPACCASCW
ncbi:hypothetical protein KAM472_39330 [Aeromonas caviae]|nr:hypothetical protein KAM471c_29080 [Aeromonas caviae]GJA87856.1 hypothetical protein KAM356_39150 [Aeromonas caviae]GJA91274.1 hypothetical protein KAM357_32220 [Aeromonas caviae]GJB04843.1 hypothetical protein KAM360_37860 [Aeromonas caviae]GJB09230.1 hypothetical protein KAM361_39030 [Aeromonas caviae]